MRWRFNHTRSACKRIFVGRQQRRRRSFVEHDNFHRPRCFDTVTHDATAENKSFATGLIAAGASANVTLSTAGRITYFCTIHPGMAGVINVQ